MIIYPQFKCCGIRNFTDWQENVYFKCCNEGIESCGVPYSCCKLVSNLLSTTSSVFLAISILQDSNEYTQSILNTLNLS